MRRRRAEATRAFGCRWPATSPGSPRGSWRKVRPPSDSSGTATPPRPAGGSGSWLPAIQVQANGACEVAQTGGRGRVEQGRPVPVVEGVAEAHDRARAQAGQRRLEPVDGGEGVVGRERRAAARVGRPLLEVQIGHHGQPPGRPVQQAGRVERQLLATVREPHQAAASGSPMRLGDQLGHDLVQALVQRVVGNEFFTDAGDDGDRERRDAVARGGGGCGPARRRGSRRGGGCR